MKHGVNELQKILEEVEAMSNEEYLELHQQALEKNNNIDLYLGERLNIIESPQISFNSKVTDSISNYYSISMFSTEINDENEEVIEADNSILAAA